MLVKIRPGGLFRCCIATIDNDAEERYVAPIEGETLTCIHCHKRTIVFHDGAWEWNRLQDG